MEIELTSIHSLLSCSSFLSDRPSQPATATRDEEEPAVFQIRNETNSDKENITFLGKSVIFGIMKINSVLLNFFCTLSCPFFLCCNNLPHRKAAAMMLFWLTEKYLVIDFRIFHHFENHFPLHPNPEKMQTMRYVNSCSHTTTETFLY